MGVEIPTRFIITNGSIEVDFIGGIITVDKWRPKTPELINGVYADRVIDTVELKASGSNTNSVISEIRKLNWLGVQAAEYNNMAWQTSRVWVEMQGRGESEVLYALLLNGRIPEGEEPFGQLFQSRWWHIGSTWDTFSFVFEHLNWSSTKPREGETLLGNANQIVPLVDNWGMTEWTGSSPDSWLSTGSINGGKNDDLDFVRAGYSSRYMLIEGANTGYMHQTHANPVDSSKVYARAYFYLVEGKITLRVRETTTAVLFEATSSKIGWNVLEIHGSLPVNITGTIQVELGSFAYGVDTTVYVDTIEYGYLAGASSSSGALTPAEPIAIANKHVIAGLTHVAQYDVSAGFTLGISATSTGLNFSINDSVGDALYFGVDQSAPNPAPFSSVVFNLSQAAEDVTYLWEYWEGSSWDTVFDVSNDSDLFTQGDNIVSWTPQDDWTAASLATIVGGTNAPTVTALWVRCRLSAKGVSGPQTAIQSTTRPFYTAMWNYISTDGIKGDIRSLLRLSLLSKYETQGFGLADERVIFGARSRSRGEFQSYINVADRGNLPGITLQSGPTIIDNAQYPAGRQAYRTTGTSPQTINNAFRIDIDGALANSYLGDFRILFIYRHTSAAAVLSTTMRMNMHVNGTRTRTEWQAVPAQSPDWKVMDFGEFNADPVRAKTPSLFFSLDIDDPTTTSITYSAVAIVLIPTDEWSGDFPIDDSSGDATFAEDYYAVFDSIAVKGKRKKIDAHVESPNNQELWRFVSRANGPISLTPRGHDQIIYMLMGSFPTNSYMQAPPTPVYETNLQKQDRYILNRGDDTIEDGDEWEY